MDVRVGDEATAPDVPSDDGALAYEILGQLADVVFILGKKGIVEWRRELRDGSTDASDDDILGTRMLGRTHPDEMATVLGAFDDLVSGREQHLDLDVRIRSAVDPNSWMRSKVRGVRLADGRVAGLSQIVDNDVEVNLTEPGAPGFSIADITPVGIALIGVSDMVAYTNQWFRDATGSTGSEISPVDRIGKTILDACTHARANGTHHTEVSDKGRDLVIRTHRVGAAGRPEVMVIVEDVTEIRALKAAQRTADRLFTTAFEHAPTGIALVGLDSRFMRVNPAFCEITGYGDDELLETGFAAITHPDDLAADRALVRQIIAGDIRSYRLDKRYLHKAGHIVWVELRVAGAYNDAGTLTHFISQVTDITIRKIVEDQQRAHEATLVHRATHDDLTDLANRAMLTEHLRLLIARVNRTSETAALLMCDLDGFKAINDTYGHLLGDRVLIGTASRLRAATRDTDLVARLGGDEFVVVLGSPEGRHSATAVAERIHAAVCEPVDDPEVGPVTVGASIGVTAIAVGDDPADALHRADRLCYEAKRVGGGVRVSL